MSSLQSIMNLDEDQPDASSPMDKKDKDSATPASGLRARGPPTSSTPSGHVIRPDLQQHPPSTFTPPTLRIPIAAAAANDDDESSNPFYNHPAQQQQSQHHTPSQDLTATLHNLHYSQGQRPVEPSSSIPTLSVASSGPSDLRRQSSTSVDSMDHQHGYGSAASSSSMGGGAGSGGYPPNHPRRPMGSPGPEIPIKLTPITGRVSRAKKGVPVHICDICTPPKTFTRAEHLSDQEGDRASQSGDSGRRDSKDSTLEGPMTGLTVRGLSSNLAYPSSSQGGFHGASTPSSSSAPATPPIGSGTGSTMSPPPGSSEQYGSSSSHQGTGHYRYVGMPVMTHQSGSMKASSDPPSFAEMEYLQQPRTYPIPRFVPTQGLSPSTALPTALDQTPDLIHSGWTSSGDDNYSTPPEVSTRRSDWRHTSQHNLEWPANSNLLSQFATGGRQEIDTSGGGIGTMAGSYYVPTAGFPSSPHMASVSQSYHALLSDPLMSTFTDEHAQSLLDPAITAQHAIDQRTSSVRRHTPETSISTSGQAADTLVTPAPLPHRINSVAQARQKEMIVDSTDVDVAMSFGTENGSPHWSDDNPASAGILTGSALTGMGECGGGSGGSGMGGPAALHTLLPRPVRNAISDYINIYWERFHVLYPFIHRPTCGGEEVLRCAMAAIATQYLNGKEDRKRGNQLHEWAWQEAKRHPYRNLQVMQAILLCEHFARFRGRKAVVRPSKLFTDLYARILDHNPNLYDSALSSDTPSFGNHQQNMGICMAKEERWRTWLEAEGRRRLLASCFTLDCHASTYHQVSRAKDDIDPTRIPLTGPSESLWAATSAEQWATILDAHPQLGNPQFLPNIDSLRPEDIPRFTIFDQASILSAAALMLPRRYLASRSTAVKNDDEGSGSSDDLRTPTTASYAAQQLKRLKPEDRVLQLCSRVGFHYAPWTAVNVFLALHHTPLHDLLAVSGDSWVFSQKVLGATTFLEHQKRLKAWTEGRSPPSPTSGQPTSPTTIGFEGMSSAKATLYAARALASFLERPISLSNGLTPHVTCLSNYWAMYVCALIIWAFGNRAGKSSFSSSSGSGISSSPTSKGATMSEEDAVAWLQTVAQLDQPEDVARMRQRKEASATVVSMVKRRLEADCGGGTSRLFVEAVGILRKLEEGVTRRWF
ncbi:hypothetical protein M406DRAFT_334470 [Cryphonectria parasitica EP155]|uniref:Xylanolytic transcriptional activator regulatory domain-containing protein n=1 Tax=Cryphonectria parasitica (strain ATCC 38755 / EP155) TaxID=660469 RepID=A0A9P5CIP3_CRYP1|nr:uncharacterized protein M406DRAFT_334470 [Cryphonectria parasitica EP155]KAF3760849.1 hypothetical protein M406DRAFT_334470 [Cryphonectria parasitica EP155]